MVGRKTVLGIGVELYQESKYFLSLLNNETLSNERRNSTENSRTKKRDRDPSDALEKKSAVDAERMIKRIKSRTPKEMGRLCKRCHQYYKNTSCTFECCSRCCEKDSTPCYVRGHNLKKSKRIIGIIEDCMTIEQKIAITYAAGSNPGTQRYITPLRWFSKGIKFIALCHRDNVEKYYCVEFVTNIRDF